MPHAVRTNDSADDSEEDVSQNYEYINQDYETVSSISDDTNSFTAAQRPRPNPDSMLAGLQNRNYMRLVVERADYWYFGDPRINPNAYEAHKIRVWDDLMIIWRRVHEFGSATSARFFELFRDVGQRSERDGTRTIEMYEFGYLVGYCLNQLGIRISTDDLGFFQGVEDGLPEVNPPVENGYHEEETID